MVFYRQKPQIFQTIIANLLKSRDAKLGSKVRTDYTANYDSRLPNLKDMLASLLSECSVREAFFVFLRK